MTKIYLIVTSYDCEGFGAPIKGYFSLEEAQDAEESLNAWRRVRPTPPECDSVEDYASDEDWCVFEKYLDLWKDSFPLELEGSPPIYADSYVILEVEVE